MTGPFFSAVKPERLNIDGDFALDKSVVEGLELMLAF
jgi:hypothetical protein